MYKMTMNLKYPRLTYLGIGVAISILVSIFLGNHYDNVLKQQYTLTQTIMESNERLLKEQTIKIESLSAELKEERKKSKTHKIIHSDGSSEEWTESESESIESKMMQVRQEEKLKIEQEKQKEIAQIRQELLKEQSSRNKLTLSFGLDTDMNRYVIANYGAFLDGRLGILGGVSVKPNSTPSYLFGLGISF